MIMRFYWGLGVGHVYSHGDAYVGATDEEEGEEASDAASTCEPRDDGAQSHILVDDNDDDDSDDDDENENTQNNVDLMAEFSLSDRENDPWASDDDDEDKDQPGFGGDEADIDDSGGEEELELDYTYNRHHHGD